MRHQSGGMSSVSVVLFVVAVSTSLVLGNSSPVGAHWRRHERGQRGRSAVALARERRQLHRRRELKENKDGSKTAGPAPAPAMSAADATATDSGTGTGTNAGVGVATLGPTTMGIATPAGTSAPSANGTSVTGTAQPSVLPVPAPTSTSTTTSTSPPSASPTVEVYDCFDNNPCMDAAAEEGGVRYYRHADPTRFVHCGAGATCFTMDCHEGRIWSLADTACVSNAAAPADQGP